MWTWWLGSAVFLHFLAFGAAEPIFHVVNSHNVDGSACNLPSANKSCPLLCVRDPSTMCPANLRPVCPFPQVFCGDGLCHQTCIDAGTNEAIPNACTCPGKDEVPRPSDDMFYPCAAMEIVLPNYNVHNSSQVVMECANVAQLWSSEITSARSELYQQWGFLSCTSKPALSVFFTEPGYVAFYACLGIISAFFVMAFLLKRCCLNPKKTSHSTKLLETDESIHNSLLKRKPSLVLSNIDLEMQDVKNEPEVIENVQGMTQTGYKENSFLVFSFRLLVVTSIGWQCLLGVCVYDYYTGTQLFHSHLNGVFVFVWHCCLFWFAFLKYYENVVRNWFRVQCPLCEATVVCVWRAEERTIFLADDGFLLKLMKYLREFSTSVFGESGIQENVPVMSTSKGTRYIEYQCVRYAFNDSSQMFEAVKFTVGTSLAELMAHTSGLTKSKAEDRTELSGLNSIPIPLPSWPVFFGQEFWSFFYLYQVMCLWVWYYFAYYYMGILLTVVILISGCIKVVVRRANQKSVQQMAATTTSCTVLRDGARLGVNSDQLAVGDLVILPDEGTVPCDLVVVKGSLITDESMLTGESMPVQKIAVEKETDVQASGINRKCTLFAGTKILKSGSEHEVHAVALSTGPHTDKGQLIQNILFPSPIAFIFDEHLKVVVCILLLWGFIAFLLAMYLMGRGDVVSWFYGIFTISQIMSPLLPAVFVVGQTMASKRLVEKGIYCINLNRITISGKIGIFCFDKTGTLTREGLDFRGVQPIREGVFGDVDSVRSMPLRMQTGLGTCHSVSTLDGSLVGNSVDVKMFEATGFTLSKTSSGDVIDTDDGRLRVLKRFEFDHGRMTMSVIVQDEKSKEVHVFTKGGFEKLGSLCRKESLPTDFGGVTTTHAREGCYVLAIAHKSLGVMDEVAVDQATKIRDEVESGLNAMGLILFRNELKHDTADAIRQIKEGNIRTVMITGDNALTGSYISRAAALVEERCRIALGDVDKATGQVVWKDMDSGEDVNHQHTKGHYELAITGPAFAQLLETGEIKDLLLHTRIFARMRPEQKVQCVQLHMERSITGMCGDGGNDCGALRAAHAGVALSDAEASIVSPFSSKPKSVMSCVELLKEGRCALATSFSSYKFLIMYGETMAYLSFMQYYFSVIMAQWLWILVDGFITVGLSWALTFARPAETLAPKRPTARLLGPQTLASILGHMAINCMFLVGAIAFLFRQPWFLCNEFDASLVDKAKWWLLGDNYEAEVIGLVVLYQFVNTSAMFNFGGVFRQSWIKNWVLAVLWVVFIAIITVLVLANPNPFSCFFRINCGTAPSLIELGYDVGVSWPIDEYNTPLGHNVLPPQFRGDLLALCVGNIVAGVLYEYFVIIGPVGQALKRWYRRSNPIKKIEFSV